MTTKLPTIPSDYTSTKWILYYPSTAKTIDDYLMIRQFITSIKNRVRKGLTAKQKTLVRIRDDHTCQLCGQAGNQVDHIKELWIFAIETIVQQQPHTEADLERLFGRVQAGEFDEVGLNELDNLRVLCRKCNSARNSYRKIRSDLESRYPVVFKGADVEQFQIALERGKLINR